MYGVFLISESGETLVSVGSENINGNTSLMGPLLSAIQIFVKKISGADVDELQVGKMKLLVSRIGNDYAVTLHDSEDVNAEKDRLRAIKLLATRNEDVPENVIIDSLKRIMSAEEGSAQRIQESIMEWSTKVLKAASEWADKVF